MQLYIDVNYSHLRFLNDSRLTVASAHQHSSWMCFDSYKIATSFYPIASLVCIIMLTYPPPGPGPSIQSTIVTNQQMDDIAAKLGAQWKTLATYLEMKAAELREIETESEDVDMQAKLLLVAWQDREGTQATVENLVAALNAAGFSQIADGLNEA